MTALMSSDVTHLSLADLASTANREHGLALQSGAAMVEHAIRAGEVLMQARSMCSDGEWRPWLADNFDAGNSTATAYMRIAHYKEQVLEAGALGINQANFYLRGLPGPSAQETRTDKARYYPEEMRDEANRLYASGIKFNEIARLLGITKTTAHAWCDPAYAAHHRAQLKRAAQLRRDAKREETEAARQRAIKRAVRKRGGAIAELYAMAERMQDVMGQAHDEETDREARQSLSLAGQHYRRMRDEIVKALGHA